MTDKSDRQFFENWQTIAVTALAPRWVNVWRRLDRGLYTEPSPALLLQESTSTTEWWRENITDGGFTPCSRNKDHERMTRVVFAALPVRPFDVVDVACDRRWLECHLAARGPAPSADVKLDAAVAGVKQIFLVVISDLSTQPQDCS